VPVSRRALARPAVAITTPCLTRHLAFFFPKRLPSGKYAERDKDPLSQDHVRRHIAGYALHLLRISKNEGQLAPSRLATLRMIYQALNTGTNVCIDINTQAFCSLSLRAVLVLYREHFTVTYILDKPYGSTQKSTKDIKDVARVLIDELVSNRYLNSPCWHYVNNNKYLNDLLYRQIWVAVDLFLTNHAFLRPYWNTVIDDCRGVIVTADETDLTREKEIFSDIQRSMPTLATKTLKPDIMRYFDRNKDFFVDSLDMDSSKHQLFREQESSRWDSNPIVCYMGNKIAIYGSTLFLQDRRDARLFEITAAEQRINNNDYIRYFLLFDGTSDYSLGRLVRRLHVLSELRAIAFVERHTVTATYESFLDVGAALSATIEKLTKSTLPMMEMNELNSAWNDIGRAPTSIDEKGLKTKSEFWLGEKKITYNKCYGGYSYRINRSVYYYNELINRLGDLRVERIKGFQPYDRFIHRNYHQMIEAMRSIGERRTALDARIDRMQSMAHTLQQRMLAQYILFITIFIAGASAYGFTEKLFEEDNYTIIEAIFGVSCRRDYMIFDAWQHAPILHNCYWIMRGFDVGLVVAVMVAAYSFLRFAGLWVSLDLKRKAKQQKRDPR